MMLTEKHKDKIHDVLSCYDRVVIKGTIPQLCFAKGMTSYLHSQGIRIFDYTKFAEPFRNAIRTNAEKLASDHGIPIEFIRKAHIRKEDIIAGKLKDRGSAPGLVAILSVMESCPSYRPWHDKKTGKTFLKGETSKCLHYYFYFIDELLGLCYVRVPTWCPFGLQIYFNGHNWLASLLQKKGIGYSLVDNAFDHIDDFALAQKLADSFDVNELHEKLNQFALTYCPVIQQFDREYHWSVMQIEYALDIVFHQAEDLQSIYGDLLKTAIHTVTPDNIATFLGKKNGVAPQYQGEVGSAYNVRLEGRRIKHHMGSVSIKMYDKFGKILRIETTANDISFFKHYREIEHKDGSKSKRITNFKKNIYSMGSLRTVLAASNHRYLDFISQIETRETGRKNLSKVSESKELNNRRYKGFNFFDSSDVTLFKILFRGEFCIQGFQNKTLRKYLPDKSSGQISRLLKRLQAHGLIKKVSHCYKYYLTSLGKQVISTALKIKEMFIIPDLNVIRT